MILFLYGADSYRLKERLLDIIEQYRVKHKSGLNLGRFDDKTFDIGELKERLSVVSIFAEKKLVVLENALPNKSSHEQLLEFLKESSLVNNKEDFLLVAHHIELSNDRQKDKKILEEFEKDKLFVYLQKNASKVERFDQLTAGQLRNWVAKEFQKRGVSVTSEALEFFLANLPSDLWILGSEIEKLSLYKAKSSVASAKEDRITISDVQALIPQYFSPEIFTTIDALAQKNKKLALELVHQHLSHGDDPIYLLSMFAFQLRNLLFLKTLQERRQLKAGSTFGLHPFVLRKTLGQCRFFTLVELQKIYNQLFEAELAVKTGKLEPATAVDFFITGIA